MGADRFSLDDFELYRLARAFRVAMYKLSRELPSDEKYILVPQIRRAALSITNNIAEGHGRWFYQDNARFCRFARGSVEEVFDDLNACIDEQYFPTEFVEQLKGDSQELIKRINGYIAYLKRSQQGKDEEAGDPTHQPRHTRHEAQNTRHETPVTRHL
jgi:four helix bundle protein